MGSEASIHACSITVRVQYNLPFSTLVDASGLSQHESDKPNTRYSRIATRRNSPQTSADRVQSVVRKELVRRRL